MRTITATLLAATLLHSPVLADTLVDNVKGQRIAEDGSIQPVSAMVFDDTGVIRAVYAPGQKPSKKGVKFHIDGQGRVLLPGMVDAHANVMQTGFAALSLDLSDTTSLADALTRLAAFAAAHPDRAWITGRGWDAARWNLGRMPTAADLDAALPGRPVWLRSRDGQAGLANTAALRAAGIAPTTPVPAGGRIERGPDGGPSGMLTGTAMDLLDKAAPAPTARDYDGALQVAQREFFRRGITAVADMGTQVRDWQAFRRAGDANRLYIRIVSYASGLDNMIVIGGPGPSPWLYADRLRMAGVHFVMDGALASYGAWLKAPYADKADTRGQPRLTQTQIGNVMSRAAMDDFQIAVDATGDEANATLLGAMADLTETYKGDRRWRVEGAALVDPADLATVTRIAGNGGIAVTAQPVRQLEDRTVALARLGADRAARLSNNPALRQSGARLAFGSASPAARPDPWVGLSTTLSATPAITMSDRAAALAGWTSTATWASFADARFGRLAPGQRADFIFVDTDPATATVEQIRATRVLQTWVGGGKVWDAARPEGGAEPDPAPRR